MSNVKETKECLEFVLRFAEATDRALQDGKFSFLDLPTFMPVMMLFNDALDGAKQIGTEMASMGEAEKAELHAVIETLNLKNPKHDEIAEESLKVMASVVKLIGMIREAKK